jgi:hypothetical protein
MSYKRDTCQQIHLQKCSDITTFVVTEPAPGRSLPTAITQVYEWAEPATLPVGSAQRGGSSTINGAENATVFNIERYAHKITVPATLALQKAAQPGGASYFRAIC